MVRWDSPLITSVWTDEDVDIDSIWQAVTEGVIKPPNVGTQAVSPLPFAALESLHVRSTNRFKKLHQAPCRPWSKPPRRWCQPS